MKKRSFIASLAGVVLLAASLPAVSADTPSIVSVSAPPDSSDLYAWAFDTGIYSIAFPVKDPEHIGIGYIVEPEPFARGANRDSLDSASVRVFWGRLPVLMRRPYSVESGPGPWASWRP